MGRHRNENTLDFYGKSDHTLQWRIVIGSYIYDLQQRSCAQCLCCRDRRLKWPTSFRDPLCPGAMEGENSLICEKIRIAIKISSCLATTQSLLSQTKIPCYVVACAYADFGSYFSSCPQFYVHACIKSRSSLSRYPFYRDPLTVQ